jgi:hypothetical protein
MDALTLDGNAVAGVLQEVFAAEMTTAVGTCGSCGATDAVGAVRVYRGAGIVLRCPSCEAVLMTVVSDGSRTWLDLRGLQTIELRH